MTKKINLTEQEKVYRLTTILVERMSELQKRITIMRNLQKDFDPRKHTLINGEAYSKEIEKHDRNLEFYQTVYLKIFRNERN